MWLGSAGSEEESTTFMCNYLCLVCQMVSCGITVALPQGRVAQWLHESVCLDAFDWTHWLRLVRVQFLSGLSDCSLCPDGQLSTTSEGNPSMHCHTLVEKWIKDRVYLFIYYLFVLAKGTKHNLKIFTFYSER